MAGDSLRRFMLGHVLAREIGHHMLRHERGLRGERTVRTGDHEACAEVIAAAAGNGSCSPDAACRRVENPASRQRIAQAADLLGAWHGIPAGGRLIAVENTPQASDVYGRAALRGAATLALGHERRGLPRATLAAAGETVAIPAASRTVNTLNVAAAAAAAVPPACDPAPGRLTLRPRASCDWLTAWLARKRSSSSRRLRPLRSGSRLIIPPVRGSG